MSKPIIPTLPPAPVRKDAPVDFVAKADAFVAAMNPWGSVINDFGVWVDDQSEAIEIVKNNAISTITNTKNTATSEINATKDTAVSEIGILNDEVRVFRDQAAASNMASSESADRSQDYSQIALASANFKGQWINLSGALSIPASSFHAAEYWMLVTNVANVSAHEIGRASCRERV